MWLINKLRPEPVATASQTLFTRFLAASFLFFFIKGMVWLAVFALAWARLF
jgi:hypothetical protein